MKVVASVRVTGMAATQASAVDASADRLPSIDETALKLRVDSRFRKFGDSPADWLFRDAVIHYLLGKQP